MFLLQPFEHADGNSQSLVDRKGCQDGEEKSARTRKPIRLKAISVTNTVEIVKALELLEYLLTFLFVLFPLFSSFHS